MPEEPPPPQFEFDLADFGDVIRASSADDLLKWVQGEEDAWKWLLEVSHDSLNSLQNEHRQVYNAIRETANRWRNSPNNPREIQNCMSRLNGLFQSYYCQRRIFHSSNSDAAFISALRAKGGDFLAAGAYYMLLRRGIAGMPAKMFEGTIEAFLYEREIDWTATAHGEALNKLRQEYASSLEGQNVRLEGIKASNDSLNSEFGSTLEKHAAALIKLHDDRTKALDALHEDQSKEFREVLKKHVDNLTAIEQTYDRKLALQKTVEYWNTKETHHRNRSLRWGIAAIGTMVALAGSLGVAVYNVLSPLQPNENPNIGKLAFSLLVSSFRSG